MPTLSEEEQKQYLGPTERTCPKCGQVKSQNYCRRCDEFFYECGCPIVRGSLDDHIGHRTY